MSSDKNLTLKMKIMANAKQAMAEIKLFDSTLRRWTSGDSLFGQMGSGAKMGFGLVGKTASIALAPLKVFAGIAGIAGLAAGAMGGYALHAAGNMESLQMRLEAVLPSIDAAKKAMAESEQYFGASPFYIDDIVEARIKLESIGVRGTRAIKSLGNASAITKRSLADMAGVISSMESEPLKAMGIRMQQEGEKATFTFYDKMGKMKTIAAEGSLEIRKSILKIFDIKFGSAVDRLLGTFGAKFDVLKGNLFRGAAKFGEGLLPGSGDFLNGINEQLTKLIDGGQLEEWGKRAGAWLSSAVAQVMASVQTIEQMWGHLSTQGPAAISEALMVGLDAVLKSAALVFVGSITGSANMLLSLGKMMGAAFVNELMAIRIPGISGSWEVAGKASEALGRMTEQEKEGLRARGITVPKVAERNFLHEQFSREQLLQIVLNDPSRGREFTNAAAEFGNSMTDMLAQMKNDVAASFSEAGAKLKDRTGFDFGATMEKNLTANQEKKQAETSSRWLALEPVYMRSNTGEVAKDSDGRRIVQSWTKTADTVASADEYSEGLKSRGGSTNSFESKSGKLSGVGTVEAPQERLIIRIENLNVKDNGSLKDIVNEAIRRVAPNQFAPAGT